MKAKSPELYRELKSDRRGLEDHLDLQAERARAAYEAAFKRIAEANPGQESWALQAAQEIVVRDVLDPTT